MSWYKQTHSNGKVLVIGSMTLESNEIEEDRETGKSSLKATRVSVLVGVSSYQYENRTAVLAVLDSGEVYGVLSSNVVDAAMEPGEFCFPMHNYSEKEAKRLLSCGGPITDTGRKVRSGFVEMPVFKIDLASVT